MKSELELKLQAYLDGELSPRQARKVAAWLGQDAEAQALAAELRSTKAALAGAELEPSLPETPEFYWSKIQREIARWPQAQPKPTPGFLLAWRRLLVPAAGVALIAFLSLYTFRIYEGEEDPAHHLAVVENLSEHTGAYSFRSQSEKMFVVWVYDRSQESEAEPEPMDEPAEQ